MLRKEREQLLDGREKELETRSVPGLVTSKGLSKQQQREKERTKLGKEAEHRTESIPLTERRKKKKGPHTKLETSK